MEAIIDTKFFIEVCSSSYTFIDSYDGGDLHHGFFNGDTGG
ncbi:hypothetical protein ACFC3W_01470 [Enterococcus durans]